MIFWAEVSSRALETTRAEGLPEGRPSDQPRDPHSVPPRGGSPAGTGGKGKLCSVITIAVNGFSPQHPSLRALACLLEDTTLFSTS